MRWSDLLTGIISSLPTNILNLENVVYLLPYVVLITLFFSSVFIRINLNLSSSKEFFKNYFSYWVHSRFTFRESRFNIYRFYFLNINKNVAYGTHEDTRTKDSLDSTSLTTSGSFSTRLTLLHSAFKESRFRIKGKKVPRYEFGIQNTIKFIMNNFERVLYYLRNWVYSTNHKRIAVNYFWFVILSGVCGMILATIIRLEMAYPGIGVLAGDSLQYLSVVTAHAVIMVFFMIMPLLFGAFGNFLLPTQLGVHDVAFPRLNSAAFWFLPGGLLMLAQLICLDRRYQRMNCFNIRELQTLLKNRYHPELLDEKLHTDFLSQSVLTTRFKLFNLTNITPRMSLFEEFSLFYTSKTSLLTDFNTNASSHFNNYLPFYFNISSYWLFDTFTQFYINVRSNSTPSYTINVAWSTDSRGTSVTSIYDIIIDYYNTLQVLYSKMETIISELASVYTGLVSWGTPTLFKSILSNLTALPITSFSLLLIKINNLVSGILLQDQQGVNTSNLPEFSFNQLPRSSSTFIYNLYNSHEESSDYRFQKTQTPVFRYDFRVGNYMPEALKLLNKHSFITLNDVTMGLRRAPWYFSEEFLYPLSIDLFTHLAFFGLYSQEQTTKNDFISSILQLDKEFKIKESYLAQVSPTGGFYNFFSSFTLNTGFVNLRWLSINTLDQKFHHMYTSSSMQQRVYANWRQLKFTREAWRCKLLASRHQNTLYRRYIHEDYVFWSVERNAKDVLPGWAMITPFSARTRFTAIGKVDLGLMGVFLVLNSSIVSSANFLVTYRYLSTLNNRKMRDARSFFTEGVMVASWMMIAANPMLVIGILMLLSDRHWQTSFFDYSGGGDTVLFQHMFWFFGHPEVYVIMIPTFGFNNTILSFYLRKRVSARASLMYSMYTIAFLGFFVWGHHMYMVGLAHTTRMLFSTLTVMISVPAATKLMHWCVTIVNSSISLELPLVFQFIFIFFFVSGGVSGMCVAHTGMDILFHDSFYVVGHFHVMLAGAAMFGSFGAFYFYFPSIFGVKFSRLFGYLHLVYYLLGQLMTVIPMFWLGYASMPRRVLDYPASMGGWHSIVSAGHLLSVAGMMAFFIMIFDSMRIKRAVVRSSFGVARFNTRLNFYIYEGARTWFLQRKGWHNARTQTRDEMSIYEIPYKNFEVCESTLLSYVLLRQPNIYVPKKEREDTDTTMFTDIITKQNHQKKEEPLF